MVSYGSPRGARVDKMLQMSHHAVSNPDATGTDCSQTSVGQAAYHAGNQHRARASLLHPGKITQARKQEHWCC